jgi:dTMP kinase
MQLMYVANRYERRPEMTRWLEDGSVLVCDRYLASSIAYGEAQGLDAAWLRDIQRHLQSPDLTILLDIAPETAVQRKAQGRDRYERDLALLARVRDSYRRQAAQAGWLTLNGERGRDDVSRDVVSAIETLLVRP